jgi:DNA-binding NtrC family response regulator
MISKALANTGGNQTQAAKQLGIGERTLRYRLKKLGFK